MYVKPLAENSADSECLLPLTKVDIDVMIEAGFATCDLDLTYQNPSSDCSLEATYEYLLEKNTLLAELKAELNGKIVEAQVREKV